MFQIQQLDLFPAPEPILIFEGCDIDGPVCKEDEILEVISLADKKIELRIELARDGERWMFSSSVSTRTGSSSYRVGKKWGKFTINREDAIHFAKEEILKRAQSHNVRHQAEKLLATLNMH